MTKAALTPDQRKLVELIEVSGFGVIERLWIRGGLPCYEPEPRIVQTIKLDSEPEPKPDGGDGDLSLKNEFESLFDQISRLRDGVVDIEVRHSRPFRLALEPGHKERKFRLHEPRFRRFDANECLPMGVALEPAMPRQGGSTA